ncbi:MAG: type II toxin-antitoxin system HicB family antitoxin [Acidobacteriota bacterium]|jgi:antitoxin HicB|nr:type II toxin-antitoxin system HicB family antitoxin [Acidobacteriota bacterium]
MREIYKLPLVLEPQPEGGWTITCPILSGLITEADTIDEIVPNVTDALEALIEGYEEINLPLPEILKPVRNDAPFLTDTIIQLETV